ncbi:MAG: SDR family oxidoreductase [Deltaproteobacteria bacterium]|nr:SDR family oxidoreductase [Deltaproteobacteria bacterium]
MDLGLTGKIALVTGGSRGIGRAAAMTLAKAGCDVAISYVANEAAAQETVTAIEGAGGKARAYRFDVADAAATKKSIDEIVKAHGGLHILVANAGIAVDGLAMRFKDEDLERVFRTNVFGAYNSAKAAIYPMMKAKWGRIIFMGSVVGEMGNVGQSAYAGSKAALDGVARSLAREVASRNITANVIAPGFIETEMTGRMTEEMKNALIESIPLGSIGRADDVADLVAFLVSERARYITGQVIHVNGGLYM